MTEETCQSETPIPPPSPRHCQECRQVNELDQWFEAPGLAYLLCPRCAVKYQSARPIHINTVASWLLEAYEDLERLGKLIRRLAEQVEPGAILHLTPEERKLLDQMVKL